MDREQILKAINPSRFTLSGPNYTDVLNDYKLEKILSDFPQVSKDSLFIVNDQFRSTPTSKIISMLRVLGKIREQISFLIATGTHEPPSYAEAVKICGAENSDKIIFHDVRKLTHPKFAGITSRGTKVLYNPAIDQYRKILTIGSVEPHYFAGFTGGAKSLVPGIAAKETTVGNHKLAMSSESDLIKTDGNPVFEDIWEAASLIRPLDTIYSVQLVNHGNLIMQLSHGNVEESFQKALNASKSVFTKTFTNKFDHIISFAQPPLDKNLYQSHKCITNSKNLLKVGGSLVLVSKCSGESGDNSFLKRLSIIGSYEDVLNKLNIKSYEFGDHKAYKLAETAKNFKLFYVGDLASSIASTAFMKKISENSLISLCNNWHNNGDSVLIDQAGGFTAYRYAT